MTPDETTKKVLAAAVAVAIIESGDTRNGMSHQEKSDVVALHSVRTLAKLGLTKEFLPSVADVHLAMGIRRGWSDTPVLKPLRFQASCLECDKGEVQSFIAVSERKEWIRSHRETAGHEIVSRWEQPSIM